MIVDVGNPELWEAVATVQLVQAYPTDMHAPSITALSKEALFDYAALRTCSVADKDMSPQSIVKLDYAKAYRAVDSSSKQYAQILAEENGFYGLNIGPPKFPGITVSEAGSIVVAPWGIQQSLNLPFSIWRAVVKLLRSYGDVVLVGRGQHERLDVASFPENDMYLSCPLKDKLDVVANSKLVLGVPNEWMWIAMGLDKQNLCVYPDNIPQDRWWWTGQKNARLVYQPFQLQIPVVLAGIRRLLGQM